MGKPEDAISAYKKAVKVNPRFGKAYNNLGVVYGSLGRAEEAAFAYGEALKIDPDDAYARANLARIK